MPVAAVATYTYDMCDHAAAPMCTTTERGLPVEPDRYITYDPDGLRPAGVLGRPDAPTGTLRLVAVAFPDPGQVVVYALRHPRVGSALVLDQHVGRVVAPGGGEQDVGVALPQGGVDEAAGHGPQSAEVHLGRDPGG